MHLTPITLSYFKNLKMEYKQCLFLFLLLALNGCTTVNASLSCPERECQSVEQPKIYPPKIGCNSNDLSFESLFNYTTDEGKVLVELLGPVDAIDSAAIIITAPHGGSEKLTDMEIPQRTCSGCKTYKDSYTLEIAMELGYGLIENYCKVPYIVVNYLHRSKLDANREIVEAAQGNAIAEEAWKAFHDFTAQAQLLVASQHGYVTASGLQGVKGLLFDVHGYSGKDWVPNVGSPFIQWGYRLSENTLDPNTWCPVDERSSGTIGSFSHARNLPGQSLECLVRGPSSLGSRINGLLPITGTVDSGDLHCGIGLPSLEFPSPKSTANNPAYCAKAKENPSDDCHYYSGGFDINVHEKIDWDKSFAPNNAMMMNAVQAEFPRCLRFASGRNSRNKVHRNLANVLAEGICGFMLDLYDESALC
jgi:hypothetical protein